VVIRGIEENDFLDAESIKEIERSEEVRIEENFQVLWVWFLIFG
jgi:hypothetical protein